MLDVTSPRYLRPSMSLPRSATEPVADFDARIHAMLGELDIDVDIKEEPALASPAHP
jgi:hypothetical protein